MAKLTTILDAIKVLLEGLTLAGGYHYDPDAVYVVQSWDDERLFDVTMKAVESGLATIYAVRAGDSDENFDTTGDASSGPYLRSVTEIHVLVSQEFKPATKADLAYQAVEDMLADVKRVLITNPQLGGAADSTIDVERGLTINRDFPKRGWVGAVLTFPLEYSYPVVSP